MYTGGNPHCLSFFLSTFQLLSLTVGGLVSLFLRHAVMKVVCQSLSLTPKILCLLPLCKINFKLNVKPPLPHNRRTDYTYPSLCPHSQLQPPLCSAMFSCHSCLFSPICTSGEHALRGPCSLPSLASLGLVESSQQTNRPISLAGTLAKAGHPLFATWVSWHNWISTDSELRVMGPLSGARHG